MLRLINKNIKIALLVFLPAYFLFLNNSMRSYHSHIFASGFVVTHSHPIEDTNQTNSGANQCEGQLIIFHGLMQDAPDDTQFSAFILPLSYFVTTIDFPSESGFAIWEKELRMGRAPPVPG